VSLCVCANQPIYFVTLHVTTLNIAVTGEFNYDSFTGEKRWVSYHNTMLCSALLCSFHFLYHPHSLKINRSNLNSGSVYQIFANPKVAHFGLLTTGVGKCRHLPKLFGKSPKWNRSQPFFGLLPPHYGKC
jgi:hypothetical protein